MQNLQLGQAHQSTLAHYILLVALAPLPFATPGDRARDLRTEQIRSTINRLFENNIRAGTSTVAPGIQAYTRVPMSEADIAEITAFGDDAIPALAEALMSPKPRFRELAVRCLGYMGSAKSIHLLELTVLSPGSESLHIQALEFMGWHTTPDAESSLHRIVELSTEEGIRKRASQLLQKR